MARPNPTRASSFMALILRLFWIIVGPVCLAALAALIGQRSGYSAIDVAYAWAAALIVLARFVDIAHFGGSTADGRPASSAHFRAYALKVVVGAAALWAAAHWARSLL
jgi:hypothetical protein